MTFVVASGVQELPAGMLPALARMLGAERVEVCDGGGHVLDRWSDQSGFGRCVPDVEDHVIDAISHDLRTPLTSVLGFAATLHERGADLPAPVVAQACGEIERAAQQMSSLLDDLYDFARASHARARLALDDVDVAGVARRLVSRLGIGGVEFERASMHVTARVDALKVELMLEHLIRNAERHCPDDRRVIVAVRREEDSVCIEVEDDGPGIPDELRSHVFEPFARSQPASRTGEGAGMGLAIVQRLAALHGGRVVADRSERLGGARVAVLLPVSGRRGHRRPLRMGRPWEGRRHDDIRD